MSVGALRPARINGEWLGVTAALLLLTAACVLGEAFERLDHAFYDSAAVLWQRPAPEDVVIVAIDDDSIAQVGRWPWRRAVHATLLERLTRDGARAVGMDIMFAEPDKDDPAGDSALEQAIRRSGKVVLPIAAVMAPPRRIQGLPPLPALAASARALGYAHAEIDADGMIRRVLPTYRIGAEQYPHYALALWQVAKGGSTSEAPSAGTDASRMLNIAYAGPAGHFRHVPYADVLRGAVVDGFFRDKIVLVGATAAGLGDVHATPTAHGTRQMSGVEIYANVLDMLRRPILLRPLAPAAAAALAAFSVLLLMLGLRRTSPRAGLTLALAAALGTLALSALLLRAAELWYAPSAALLGCVLAYPLWSWRRLEATQSYLDAELGRMEQEPALFSAAASPGTGADPLQRRIDAVHSAVETRRRSQRFISAALDSLPVGVVVTDASRRVLLANRKAVDLLGTEVPGPVRGRTLNDLLSALRPPPNANLGSLLDAASWSILARQIEIASADSRPLLVGIAATDDESGGLSGLVVSLSDITELRRAQKARDETMRYLSHDLRSPLMSIISMIDVMQDPDGQDLFSLDSIQQLARRALNLADDVMRLARAEALDPQRFRSVDLAVLGSQAVEEAAPLGYDRAIDVEFASAAEPGRALCKGDGELLRRALINLLNNAIQHSPDRSKVSLILQEEAGEWALTVEDHGPGIPADQLPKLFSPYASTRARGQEGTGLGLVIVKTVVERHGGTLTVLSHPGQGTRFVVRLAQRGNAEAEAHGH